MKHVKAVILGLMFILVYSISSTAAETDIKGSKDLSFIPRLPGFFISGYSTVELGSSKFIGRNIKASIVEGTKTFIEYRLMGDAPVPGELKIRRTLQENARKMGGSILFDDNFNRCSTIVFQKDGMAVWTDVRAYDKMYRLTIIEKKISGPSGTVADIQRNVVTIEDGKGGRLVIQVASAEGLKVGDPAWCEEDCGHIVRTWDAVVNVQKVLEQNAWGDPHVDGRMAR